MEFRKRRVAGVGINNSPTPVAIKEGGKQTWICPKYDRWKHLLNWAKRKGREVHPELIYFMDFVEYCESFTDHKSKSTIDLTGFVGGKVCKAKVVMAYPQLVDRIRSLSRNKKVTMLFALPHHSGKKYFYAYTDNDGNRKKVCGFDEPLDAHLAAMKLNVGFIEELLVKEDDRTKEAFVPILDKMKYCLKEGLEWNPVGEKKCRSIR